MLVCLALHRKDRNEGIKMISAKTSRDIFRDGVSVQVVAWKKQSVENV